MRLCIDGQECDMIPGQPLALGYDAHTLRDIESAREGRKVTVSLPLTPRNEALAGFARDPHAATAFNASRHTAELSCEGAVLLSGTARLIEASDEQLKIEIREGGAGWAHNAARKMFNTLPVVFRMPLTPNQICDGWVANVPVKFLPVHRDEYPQRNSSTDLLPAERLLSVEEYHPFLHIRSLIQAIFTEAGYRIESRFINSSFFRSLYMSGAYASRDTAAADNRIGFLARRLRDTTAMADSLGFVFANPNGLFNTVGNIVDTATPQSVDADGQVLTEVYNHGGCFTTEDGRIAYTPVTQTTVGFEYYLRYTTDHRILSRTRLRGMDTFDLGAGGRISLALANRYKDRRAELRPDFSYRVVVFNHTQGARYRLTCTRNGVAGVLWTEFSERSAVITSPAATSLSSPALHILSGSVWIPYTGDWALYDGYIGETGRTTVEVRLTSPPEELSPDSPKRFDTIYFVGAEPGMQFTLHKECTVHTRFSSQPGYGTLVTFADVAHHPIRQAVLIEALCHLFNLRIYTEQTAKTVYIEPADDFFRAGAEADWSAKTDFSRPVVFEDLALGIHERRTWGYIPGEGALARGDEEGLFGEWSFRGSSCASLEGEKVLRNPLFSPTLNSSGHYANAPSALLPQVGDRDEVNSDGANFLPRIVRYIGLQPLPSGERWGYPSNQSTYPLAAFHFPGDEYDPPFTLCFEDRDGAQGLHRYYDRQMVQEDTRQAITLSLSIEAHQFGALFTPGTGAPDIRSVFRIDTGRGVVRATLLRIHDYDPATGSARCTFLREPED